MAICEHCGKEFKRLHNAQRFCSPHCRNKSTWRARQSEDQLSANIKPEKYQVKKRPVLVTDAEQKKIDQEVFLKSAVTFEPAKVYRPGDPEFEQIARTVTPIEKIPTKKIIYRGINNA